MVRTDLNIAALDDTASKINEKCTFAPCKLRFFVYFCLASPAIANIEVGSNQLTVYRGHS